MNNKINIVYNWIGPTGPIPNTEVPNVLNLSSATSHVRVDTNRYWADNIWPLIFCNNENYQLKPTAYLDEREYFIYPFTIAWRIPFRYYFYNDSGLFEYSQTPEHILHMVRERNGYILVDISAEAWVEPEHLKFMHQYFDYYRIPLNKVIYLTGCMNANELYEQWIVNTGKNTNDPKIKIISFPISQDSLSSYFITHKPQIPEYDTERVPEKLFLSWNRRYREHRIAVVLMLEYLNLIERCYISFGATDPENQFMKLENSFNSYYTIDFLQPNDPCIDRLKSKLPLILDGETDVNQMCQDFNDANRSYYQNSLVSLITETNYNTNEVTLTEKSFKPIKEKHPFISIGTAGTVKALKKMGFKTFGEFWDESYDDIQEPKLRMVALVNIFKDIASWDAEKIKDFRRRVKPILDHNYEILKIKTSLNVVKEITNYITERTIV